jgi:type II secretory pathway pseudopilin PulG
VSLVEVMVALVLFAVGILPAVYAVAGALAAARRGRARADVAIQLLSEAALRRVEWSGTGRCGTVLLLRAERELPGRPVRDSVHLVVACP